MHTITIFLVGSSAQISLQFKEPLRAMALEEAIVKGREALGESEVSRDFIPFADDYGRRGAVQIEDIAGWLLGDITQSLAGAADAQMIQMRANAEFGQRVQADPKLRFLAGMASPGGLKI